MRKKVWPWLLLGASLIPAFLVNRPAAPVAASNVLPAFSEAVLQSPVQLDPARANNFAEEQVDANVFQTLVGVGSKGQIITVLAARVTYHGPTVTIHLAKDPIVNGSNLTAAMVVGSLLQTLKAPVSSVRAQNLLHNVVGMQPFLNGQSSTVSGIVAKGAHTVEITLNHAASANFLTVLANPVLAIVPPADRAQGGDDWQATNLYGTGNYRLSNWDLSGELSFSQVRPASGIKNVTLLPFPSFASALSAFQTHLVSVVPVPVNDVKNIPSADQKDLRTVDLPKTAALYWNVSNPLADSSYPKVSIKKWVETAYQEKDAAPLDAAWPSKMSAHLPLTVWVNQNNADAV
ncbi:MAG: ABC transporter substrate-binding protein, partial [Firmicutes bacterium]|nr:ABC transporter substrate-binding protein [Bacillota bacterium]